MNYKIDYYIDIEKTLKKVPKRDVISIKEKIDNLSKNPRPHGSIKLSGKDVYRIRIGNYRVIYSIFDCKLVVLVLEIDGRKDVYKNK